jgi:hypothetical protein
VLEAPPYLLLDSYLLLLARLVAALVQANTMSPRQRHYCCCALLALLSLNTELCAAASLSVVNSINDIWDNVAMQAAEVGYLDHPGCFHVQQPVAVAACGAVVLHGMAPGHNQTCVLAYCNDCDAVQATIKAIQRKTGLKDLSLRDVPMDSFQVCLLQRHCLTAAVQDILSDNNCDKPTTTVCGLSSGQKPPSWQSVLC